MTTALDTYLGWEQLTHRPDCKRPAWVADIKITNTYASRSHYRDDEARKHECPNEDCGHSGSFEETTVRLVCASCSLAYVIRGEDVRHSTEPLRYLRYGLPPRKLAGLFLWPAEPFLDFGRLSSDEPDDFVVTASKVDRVTAADVVGVIQQGRGKRGGILWAALAVPDPAGQYGLSYTGVKFAAATDVPRTVAAAAKWVAARLAEKTTRIAGCGHSADEVPAGGVRRG
ncbi:hypothetical protein [Streptomyces niveus]|uniref:hypothetical protein n=1 Tax=Streptomyces niveus TaxID=193462 RepID=UPI0036AA6E91